MILTAFTLLHVAISLVGIGSGLAVLYGMLTRRPMERLNVIFLWTTLLTSVTGFLFPVHKFLPSHAIGIISLVLLAIAITAWRVHHLAGKWRAAYVISSVMALHLNVFVLFVQLFRRVPFLEELAPTQSEPPFVVTQLAVLVAIYGLGTVAVIRQGRHQVPKVRAAGAR